jgi:hypothetical protein
MFNVLGFKFGSSRTKSKPHPYLSSSTNKLVKKPQLANHKYRARQSTSSSDQNCTTKLLQHANLSAASDMGKRCCAPRLQGPEVQHWQPYRRRQ